MANYLVTGAAGFIGWRVVEFLLADKHTVIGIDDLNDSYDVRMKEYRLKKLLALPGFTFNRCDINDVEALHSLRAADLDGLINLAARVGVRASLETPGIFVETNVLGTLNLLEFCRRRNIKKFILASTSSIYGANPPLPTPESAETDRPLQAYAASKKGAEVLCHAYRHLYDLDVTILRYFTVYGPAGRPDLAMFRFAQWIREDRPVRVNGNGEQSRGFTYLDDIARGTVAALKPLGYEIINLGGHEVITMNNLIRLFEEIIGKKARVEYGPANPADMLANWADVTKAGRLLGWQPQVSLREGVQQLVDWYDAERDWAREVVTL